MIMKLIVISLLCCVTISLSAQVDTSLNIPEVMVTANRLQQDVRSTGRHVTVVTRQDILNSGVRSIDDAIQTLGGIEAQTRGVYGAQADFSIRGSSFNQVLVLIDGQPINDPLTGHFNSNIPLNLIDIERIEIIRGPSSAIYGPDAMGGVINIVSRSFSDHNPGASLKGGYTFGDYGLRHYDIGGQFSVAGISANVFYRDINAEGPDHVDDSTSQYIDLHTLSAGLSYQDDKWNIKTRASWDKRDFDARYFYTRSSFDRSIEEVSRMWLQARLGYELSSSDLLVLNASQMRSEDYFLFNPAFSANEHKTTSSDFRLDWHHSWQNWKTVVGVNSESRDIKSNDRGDHSDQRFGSYVTGEYRPHPEWVISPSLRLDFEDEYDLEVNPQLAVSYIRDRYNIRAFAGRSIRTADYTERFVNFGRTDTLSSGRNLGNDALLPERAWSAELGAKYFIDAHLSIEATIFSRWGKDLIDYVLTTSESIEDSRLLDPAAEYFYATNIAELNTSGLELRAVYQKDFSNFWRLNTSLGYSFIDSKADGDEISKYIANHSNNLLTWQLRATYKRLTMGLDGLYKERTSDIAQAINAELEPSYHVMNSRITYRMVGNFIQLYGQVNNVLDRSYSDILGAKLPGRWWSLGVYLNWD